MRKLILIRHGATAGNLEKRYIGRTDEALCPEGIAQVETLKQSDLQIDHLFVSPMRRTRQTAQLLFPQMTYQVVPEFSEIDFGLFEGKTAEELAEDAEYAKWLDSMCLAPIPGGEAVSDFKKRCCEAFGRIVGSLPEHGCAAFVVHGGVIMAVLEAYAWPQKDFYEYHVANGNFIAVWYKNGRIYVI